MKKISIAFNIAFIGILIFLGCGKEVDRPVTADCPGCRAYDSSFFRNNTITYSTASDLASDYQRLNRPVLSTSTPSIIRPARDASTVWFPLEILKAYIYSIEKRTCNSSCTLELGVRIYFGRYPDKIPPEYDVDPLYANRHTLFMVPTYKEPGTGFNRDFDPWLMKPGTACNPDFDTSAQRGKLHILAPFGSAFNHGDLIPPRAPTGLRFYYP